MFQVTRYLFQSMFIPTLLNNQIDTGFWYLGFQSINSMFFLLLWWIVINRSMEIEMVILQFLFSERVSIWLEDAKKKRHVFFYGLYVIQSSTVEVQYAKGNSIRYKIFGRTLPNCTCNKIQWVVASSRKEQRTIKYLHLP